MMKKAISQKQIEDWNRGKMSRVILENFDPILKAQELQILSKIKHFYRNGEVEGLKYIAAAAELCAIEDLRASLTGKITKGNKAAKEILDV